MFLKAYLKKEDSHAHLVVEFEKKKIKRQAPGQKENHIHCPRKLSSRLHSSANATHDITNKDPACFCTRRLSPSFLADFYPMRKDAIIYL